MKTFTIKHTGQNLVYDETGAFALFEADDIICTDKDWGFAFLDNETVQVIEKCIGKALSL